MQSGVVVIMYNVWVWRMTDTQPRDTGRRYSDTLARVWHALIFRAICPRDHAMHSPEAQLDALHAMRPMGWEGDETEWDTRVASAAWLASYLSSLCAEYRPRMVRMGCCTAVYLPQPTSALKYVAICGQVLCIVCTCTLLVNGADMRPC